MPDALWQPPHAGTVTLRTVPGPETGVASQQVYRAAGSFRTASIMRVRIVSLLEHREVRSSPAVPIMAAGSLSSRREVGRG